MTADFRFAITSSEVRKKNKLPAFKLAVTQTSPSVYIHRWRNLALRLFLNF